MLIFKIKFFIKYSHYAVSSQGFKTRPLYHFMHNWGIISGFKGMCIQTQWADWYIPSDPLYIFVLNPKKSIYHFTTTSVLVTMPVSVRKFTLYIPGANSEPSTWNTAVC
jgi:hypothetical protein